MGDHHKAKSDLSNFPAGYVVALHSGLSEPVNSVIRMIKMTHGHCFYFRHTFT